MAICNKIISGIPIINRLCNVLWRITRMVIYIKTEPPKADNPLFGLKNCCITPHIAWAGYETRVRLMEICKENLKAFSLGNPINVVY